MKQEIKKLVVLFLTMSLFTASQETPCVDTQKSAAAPVVVERVTDNNNAANADTESPLMPISRFILLQ